MNNIQLENKDIVPPTENKDLVPPTSNRKRLRSIIIFVVTYGFSIFFIAFFIAIRVRYIGTISLLSGFTFIFCAYAIYFFTKKEFRWKRKMIFKIIAVPLIASFILTYALIYFFVSSNCIGSKILFSMPSVASSNACYGVKFRTTTSERRKEIEKELEELKKNMSLSARKWSIADSNYEKTKNTQYKIERRLISGIQEKEWEKLRELEEEKSSVSCYGFNVVYCGQGE